MVKNYSEQSREEDLTEGLELVEDDEVASLNKKAEAMQREERIQELMRLDPSLLEEVQRRSKENVATEKKTEVISEKDAHRNEILQDLGDGIHVGDPKAFNGSHQEEARGIYDKDGQFIGNILVADRYADVPKNELQDKAWELVAKSLGRDTRPEIRRDAPEVNIDSEAKKIMDEKEVSLSGDTLYLFGGEKPEPIPLFGEGENQKIEIVKGKNELQLIVRVTERRGKVIEYNINNGVFDSESRKVKLGGEDVEQEGKPKVKINIGAGVRELMAKMWMTLDGAKLNLQYGQNEIDLDNKGENEKVDLEKIDNNNILLRLTESKKKGGRVIEYTINNGTLDDDSKKVINGK